jgi:hypothetical protein
VEVTNPIQEWLDRPIPEKLWHYTSIQGFYGITTSQTIYATDYRFLNDREEVIHARKIAKELIDEYPDSDADGFEPKKAVGMVIYDIFRPNGGLFNPDNVLCHVTSFSGKRDDLSQWRGYSNGSNGHSLGFSIKRLQPISITCNISWFEQMRANGFPSTFAPCVYHDINKKILLRYALTNISIVLKNIDTVHPEIRSIIANPPTDKGIVDSIWEHLKSVQSTYMNQFTDAMCQTIGYLLLVVALLKDSSFIDEDEWRLVAWYNAITKVVRYPRKFRAEREALIPYLEIPLDKGTEVLITLNDLVLGPGSNNQAVSAAKSFLESIGIELLPGLSSIPYRPK